MSTVLVVEDSLTDTEVLTRYLKQIGLTVVSVASGEEAEAKLRQQKPDLVILDVILPGQSGFELCHHLKTNEDTKQIPVVICSSKGTEVDQLWGSLLGANAYLAKPVDRQKLMQIVQQFIT
ncbi:MAG TPA: two-component system response regulator [Cyanobacteria bacterium UBA11049]|nr:two-component system response regulator [Cyanobacteria bacterium UBA11049]